ncbi:MAG: hypothetical protein BWY95_02352 [Bacteroidetes bacterium ADurb.BinA104]|nr:MAG: hypothetical protein BWY95_02352 [Bacteroidetes bacterium ADurb.BinA104]
MSADYGGREVGRNFTAIANKLDNTEVRCGARNCFESPFNCIMINLIACSSNNRSGFVYWVFVNIFCICFGYYNLISAVKLERHFWSNADLLVSGIPDKVKARTIIKGSCFISVTSISAFVDSE